MLPTQFLHFVLNARKPHTGRDEVEIRYPVDYRLFLDSGQSLRDFRNDGIDALDNYLVPSP